MKRLLALAMLALPAHATTPITQTFTVPLSYQAAYRLADKFARDCHASGGVFARTNGFSVSGDLFTDIREGVVRIGVSYISTRETASIRVVADGDTSSTVTATVWGHGIWDGRELDAMRKSMTTGSVVCR